MPAVALDKLPEVIAWLRQTLKDHEESVGSDDAPLKMALRRITWTSWTGFECRVYDGEHLFKLRNPNGVALWKGKWSREGIAERIVPPYGAHGLGLVPPPNAPSR